jgi:hypothetical protein
MTSPSSHNAFSTVQPFIRPGISNALAGSGETDVGCSNFGLDYLTDVLAPTIQRFLSLGEKIVPLIHGRHARNRPLPSALLRTAEK